nr:amino acid ABC transporter permease [Microbacterium yannicii]
MWNEALVGTLVLFFGGGLIALVLGFIVGAMRVSPVPIARAAGGIYVNWIRNTPLTLVMFFFAFCLPILLEQRVSPIVLATAALGIYTATYVAETIRSGVNTVPVGQAEAARALGLTFGQVMSLIVLPQATRSVIPPMMSVFIALLKNTTVAAGFSAVNLGSVRSNLSEVGENQLVVLLWVMVIFVVLVLLLAWLQRFVERKWRIAR